MPPTDPTATAATFDAHLNAADDALAEAKRHIIAALMDSSNDSTRNAMKDVRDVIDLAQTMLRRR